MYIRVKGETYGSICQTNCFIFRKPPGYSRSHKGHFLCLDTLIGALELDYLEFWKPTRCYLKVPHLGIWRLFTVCNLLARRCSSKFTRVPVQVHICLKVYVETSKNVCKRTWGCVCTQGLCWMKFDCKTIKTNLCFVNWATAVQELKLTDKLTNSRQQLT